MLRKAVAGEGAKNGVEPAGTLTYSSRAVLYSREDSIGFAYSFDLIQPEPRTGASRENDKNIQIRSLREKCR